jgi:hypothetical protein
MTGTGAHRRDYAHGRADRRIRARRKPRRTWKGSNGRLDPFSKPSSNVRCLGEAAGRCRREAVVADSGLGRLNWADSARTEVASGRTGVRTKAVIPLRAGIGLTGRSGRPPRIEARLRPNGDRSLLRHPRFAQAVVHPLALLDEAGIAAKGHVVRLPCRDRLERPA